MLQTMMQLNLKHLQKKCGVRHPNTLDFAGAAKPYPIVFI